MKIYNTNFTFGLKTERHEIVKNRKLIEFILN